jgi:hypothetical protein
MNDKLSILFQDEQSDHTNPIDDQTFSMFDDEHSANKSYKHDQRYQNNESRL